MFENQLNKRKQQPYKMGGDKYRNSSWPPSQYLNPEQVAELILKRPELRLADNTATVQLAQLVMSTPEDPHAQELFQLIVRDSLGKAIVAEDEFLGNYPPRGNLLYTNDFLSLGTMPTGDTTGIIINQLTGNVLLVGRTKSAKTSLIADLLSYPKLLQTVRVVVFAKKPELRDLATIPQLRGLIITFKLEELILCYFKPPDGVPEPAWNNESTEIVGQCYARYSAQRLMGDKVNELMTNHPEGVYPTVRQLVEVLDKFRPRFGMREAAYKESILWCLKSLLACTGTIWDHSYSLFLEELFGSPGLCIIEAEALPQEHLSFIATYFMRWLYLKRIYTNGGVS